MKRSELKRMSLKRVAELAGVDRGVIADLVEQGCPRNRDGTLNAFLLATWLLSCRRGRRKEEADG